MTTPKLDRWLTAMVIFVALAMRFFYLADMEAYPKFELIKNRLDDQVVFDAWAKSIVRGEVFDYTTTGHEFAHWVAADPGVYPQAPLYPLFVAGFYAVAGFEYDGLRALQMLLGALACGLLFRFARRFLSSWAAACCGLGLAVYGPQVFYEGTLLRASLLTAIGLLALERLYRLQELLGVSPHGPEVSLWRLRGVAAVAGLALAAAVLMRPNMLLFAVAAMAWLIWQYPARRRVVAWTLLGLVVPLLPIIGINMARSGQVAFLSSNGPYIFFVSNVHDATGTSATPSPYYFEVKERGAATEVSLLEEALHDIARYPGRFVALQGRKLLAFFGPRETPNNLSFEMALETNPRLRWAALRLPHILPWALLGLYFAARRRHVLLHLFLLSYTASTVLFYVLARLRLPVVPVLLILALVALEGLARHWQASRRWRAALAVTTMLSLSVWLSGGVDGRQVLHRHSDYAMAAAAQMSRGEEFERAGDEDFAWRHYGQALAFNPQHRDALGAALRMAGQRPPVKSLDEPLENVLEEARRLSDTDPKAAERLLHRVAERAPGAPEPHHFLSNLAYLRGDVEAAGRHLEAAVERAPLTDLYRRNLVAVRQELWRQE